MANRHFGKFGDVWKHLPLAEVLRLEAPLRYVESNAGDPEYLLPHDAYRDAGAWRYLEVASRSSVLDAAVYTRLLSAYTSQDPPRYPGSPVIAREVLGPDVAFDFGDLDKESLYALGLTFGGAARCHLMDGAAMTLSLLSSADPRSTFLFLDPYHPLERLAGGPSAAEVFAEAGRRGFPAMLWYGYQYRARTNPEPGHACRDELWAAYREAGAERVWWGEVEVEDIDVSAVAFHRGFGGCGIAAVNLTEASIAACSGLGRALAEAWGEATMAEGGTARLRFVEGSG
ncbi:MAG: hypothetical protein V4850_14375 [Myxococcota bacterium]